MVTQVSNKTSGPQEILNKEIQVSRYLGLRKLNF